MIYLSPLENSVIDNGGENYFSERKFERLYNKTITIGAIVQFIERYHCWNARIVGNIRKKHMKIEQIANWPFSGESNLNVSFVVLFTVPLPFCQLPFKTNTNLNIISKTIEGNKGFYWIKKDTDV